MSAKDHMPRWDMSVVFPDLNSTEFYNALVDLGATISSLEKLFDEYGVSSDGEAKPEGFEIVTRAYNAASDFLRTVTAYIRAHTTTDSRDELASARNSEIDMELSRMRQLSKRYAGWVSVFDIDLLTTSSTLAQEHQYALRRAAISAQHLMSPDEESLATQMEVTGSHAWTKLHSKITSQLIVNLVQPDADEPVSMSMARALASSPDRGVRQKAYLAELDAWKTVEVPLAAAMNSIKGETLTLCNRRGWADPLDEAVFNCSMDRLALEAMLTAAKESFPDFRRYLKAKAKALGISNLAFFDIFAPIGDDHGNWDYANGCAFVEEQFRGFSDKMGDFAARTFRENWIDVAPRPGKVDGAFCMGLRNDESRILMNFKPSFGAVSTLAHELGHGYHNVCLAGRTALQRALPMTLAETASIFCETIIRQAVLRDGSDSEKFTVLEGSLQGSCQVVVDITSRFLFEQAVFEGRRKRELSARELCDLMENAQRETYGDGLDSTYLHPYMWAAKPHYYGRSYYNFPYMFGLLFGLGLYSVYLESPNEFKAMYDDLLSSTGMADASALGKRFGLDIQDIDFWRGSLNQIRAEIDQFESFVG